jgi:hypothetical protein
MSEGDVLAEPPDARRRGPREWASGPDNMNPAGVGFWALFSHRFGNWRMSVRPKLLRAPLTALYRV